MSPDDLDVEIARLMHAIQSTQTVLPNTNLVDREIASLMAALDSQPTLADVREAVKLAKPKRAPKPPKPKPTAEERAEAHARAHQDRMKGRLRSRLAALTVLDEACLQADIRREPSGGIGPWLQERLPLEMFSQPCHIDRNDVLIDIAYFLRDHSTLCGEVSIEVATRATQALAELVAYWAERREQDQHSRE